MSPSPSSTRLAIADAQSREVCGSSCEEASVSQTDLKYSMAFEFSPLRCRRSAVSNADSAARRRAGGVISEEVEEEEAPLAEGGRFGISYTDGEHGDDDQAASLG